VSVATPTPAASAPSSARPGPLPPGPGPRALNTYRLLTRPFEWFPRWAARYGDPFTVRAMNGDVVTTGSPEGIRQLLTAPAELFDVFAVEALSPLVGRGSLLLSAGAPHRRARKLLSPPFAGAAMRAHGPAMAAATRAQLARLGPGARVNGLELGRSISLGVIVRVIFGVQEPERIAAFERAVGDLVDHLPAAALFFRGLQRWWNPGWQRFRRRSAALDALLREQLERARRDPAADGSILGQLLAARDEEGRPLDDAEVRDQLLTLLFAGHETTAIALAWALHWIHATPGVLDRLRADLAPLGADPDPDACARLPYLEAVILEALRVYPIVTEPLRTLRAPFELLGHVLPAGAAVAPSALLAHWREETYPEPRAFRPERFLERRFSAYEFLPFGGGHRRCIGAAFATYELSIILALVLGARDLELLDPATPRPARRNVLMVPGGGVPLRVLRERR
jgi:cytochrome P450